MNIIGIDFSISKPSACVYYNNKYEFFSWPKNISDKNKKIFNDSDVHIITRPPINELYKKNDIALYDVINSNILADLIINSLESFLTKDSKIIFEGSSFGSKGNITLSITGWRYILMYKLWVYGIPFKNMKSYSPATIKKTANCSKRGMGKNEMILSFISSKENILLRNNIELDNLKFKKRGAKNWIDVLDDLIDSFFIIKTFFEKNQECS